LPAAVTPDAAALPPPHAAAFACFSFVMSVRYAAAAATLLLPPPLQMPLRRFDFRRQTPCRQLFDFSAFAILPLRRRQIIDTLLFRFFFDIFASHRYAPLPRCADAGAARRHAAALALR